MCVYNGKRKVKETVRLMGRETDTNILAETGVTDTNILAETEVTDTNRPADTEVTEIRRTHK